MTITEKQLKRFVWLSSNASGDAVPGSLKGEYKNLGRKILKYIAEQMKLLKGAYEIRWNPGGTACSGDHCLHTNKVYVALDDNLSCGWFYWRTVKGMKDYCGGRNQVVYWKDFTAPGGLDKLIGVLKVAQSGSYTDPQSGDIILNINQAILMAAGALVKS
jgi:hypothetical protein